MKLEEKIALLKEWRYELKIIGMRLIVLDEYEIPGHYYDCIELDVTDYDENEMNLWKRMSTTVA